MVFTDLVDYVNVVAVGYCFAVAVVAVGLAGFVADCAAAAVVAAGRAVAGCVDHLAAVVVAGYFVADLGFAVLADVDADLPLAVHATRHRGRPCLHCTATAVSVEQRQDQPLCVQRRGTGRHHR